MKPSATSAGKSPGRVRSFIAVDLDTEVLEAIRKVQRHLAATDADVRWVRPESMHITLRFLGNVKADLLPQLQSALATALIDQAALKVRVQGLGVFPSLRRARVLWVGLIGAGLVDLASAVATATEALGFEPDRRAFSGHVTLGRVNSLRGWESLEQLLGAHIDDDFGSTDVRSVVAYRSQLQPGGSVYTALWTIPLQQNKGTHHDA